MAASKKYFHDHLVLLLLSINVFLALVDSLTILLKLSASHGTVYYIQNRPNLGVDQYKTGSVLSVLAFVVFGLMVLGVNVMLSLGAYKIHRQLAIVILSMGILLLILNLIIGYQLLGLR